MDGGGEGARGLGWGREEDGVEVKREGGGRVGREGGDGGEGERGAVDLGGF